MMDKGRMMQNKNVKKTVERKGNCEKRQLLNMKMRSSKTRAINNSKIKKEVEYMLIEIDGKRIKADKNMCIIDDDDL